VVVVVVVGLLLLVLVCVLRLCLWHLEKQARIRHGHLSPEEAENAKAQERLDEQW
jgi:hypothetical protein